MAIQLAPLDRIRVRRIAPARTSSAARRAVRTALGTIVRSSLIGIGIGVSLLPDRPDGMVGVATLGILAIGAALASWDT